MPLARWGALSRMEQRLDAAEWGPPPC